MNDKLQEYYQLVGEILRLAQHLEKASSGGLAEDTSEIRQQISVAAAKMRALDLAMRKMVDSVSAAVQAQRGTDCEPVIYSHGDSSPSWVLFGGLDDDIRIPIFGAADIENENSPELMIDVGTAIQAYSLGDWSFAPVSLTSEAKAMFRSAIAKWISDVADDRFSSAPVAPSPMAPDRE